MQLVPHVGKMMVNQCTISFELTVVYLIKKTAHLIAVISQSSLVMLEVHVHVSPGQ